MNAVHATYIALFSAAAIACFGSIVPTRRLTGRSVRRGLAGLLVLSGLWALVVAVQLLVPTLPAKRAVYIMGLVFGFGTVFAWLYFASAYTGRAYHRDRRLVALGAAIYGLVVLVKVTNPLHGTYYTASLVSTPFPHMIVSHGTLHWLAMGIAYTLSVVGIWMLYDAFRERETAMRLYLLVGATALPAVPTALGTVAPELLLGVNYEPLGVAIFAVGTLYFAEDSFLELSAPGHAQLVDVLSEGVLLLDESDRVVSHNENATQVFPSLGTDEPALGTLDDQLATLEMDAQCIVTRRVDGQVKHFQAKKESVESGPQFIEAAITLTDVTRLVRLENVTSAHTRINEALIDADTERAVRERVCEELATVDVYRFAWVGRTSGDGVTVDCVAGDPDTYLDAVSEGKTKGDPVVDALQESTPTPNIVDVSDRSDAWTEAASELGVTACAVVTLPSPGTTDTAIGVYTTDEDGFTEPEQAIFAELHETLRHAIAAIDAHQEARRFQEAVNRAGYALCITGPDGTIRYVNPAFEETTGYAPGEAIGQTPALVCEDDFDWQTIWDEVESGTVWEGEVRNKRKHGQRYWARRTVAPVTDESGAVTSIVAIDVDITERRVREQRLTVLNRVIRHNLRNRMNVITGNAQLVLDRSEEEGVSAPAEHINETAEELTSLSEKAHTAEQFIDSSQSTERTMTVDGLLDGVTSSSGDGPTSGTVTVDPPGETDASVDAALAPVLDELIENGLEHGGTEPTVRVDACLDGGDLLLSVADDGPGLPDGEQEVLETGDESALEHGSGLGLWLVNWLVVQCGGTLEIAVDDGTTVTVRVPARTGPQSDAPDQLPSSRQ